MSILRTYCSRSILSRYHSLQLVHSLSFSNTKMPAKETKKDPGPSKEALRRSSNDYARKSIIKTFADSSIEDKSGSYPTFDYSDLKLGKVLGKGGFGTVSEIRSFKVEENAEKVTQVQVENSESQVEGGEMESRNFIAKNCIRKGGDSRYAVKILSPEVINDPPRYLQGIIDMAIETRFLSDIEHPNIIKMRATAKCDPFSEEYFIGMDRLYDTLGKRIQTWAGRMARTSGIAGRLNDRKGEKAAALYEERIVKAFDLAAAIDYLHKRNILYRDLKPENIGFDIRDDIKIFDFGLAKELTEKLRNNDGTYNLTEMTGSPRYMAPEVANAKPYNATCDSYSFAILLWEMMSLKTPYELYTPKALREKVYNGAHKRPPINVDWSVPIKLLLRKGWTPDLHDRSTMAAIVTILRKECVRARDGDDSGLEHNRRRSTFVFRPNRQPALVS